MRALTPELIDTLVRRFSHGAGTAYDPRHEIGTQRESFRSLGYGGLYMALADVLEARRILVVGSGRGFAVACFALAVEERPEARVWFVDPGFAAWPVERDVVDTAPGLWRDPARSAEHFRRGLGLEGVECLPVSSDDAFDDFRARGLDFDLVLIDGNHSLDQVGRDLDNALRCLAPRGMILAHDAACPEWPGPALALRGLLADHPELQSITLPLFPGLALVQRHGWPLEIRHATAEENEQLNRWRVAAEVTPRPLVDGDDPRPGEVRADSREGLYAVLEDGELVGGFGLRYRRFAGRGADDFPPSAPEHAAGFLHYGAILDPAKRGRGRYVLMRSWIASLLRAEGGYYFLTRYPVQGRWSPLVVRQVGQSGPFTAYHLRLRPRPGWQGGPDAVIDRLRAERDEARAEAARWREAAADARRDAGALRDSTIWRATAPLRALFDWLRGR